MHHAGHCTIGGGYTANTATHLRATCAKLAVVVPLILCVQLSQIGAQDLSGQDIASMSLEDLMNIEIVSVSRKSESLHEVASSVYVITEEDIRRSGATRLTELLDLVPGAFYSDFTYALGQPAVRSQATELPQSLLLVLDGMPLTRPLNGSPPFEFLDVPLREIDRIEVIKGPGGTMYGAGANTGIVSVFTKGAEDTEGLAAFMEGGTQDYAAPYLRYSAALGDNRRIALFGGYKTTRGFDKTSRFANSTLTVPREGQSDTVVTNQFPRDDTDGLTSLSLGGHLDWQLSPQVASSTKLSYRSYESSQYQTRFGDPVRRYVERTSRTVTVQEQLDISWSERHSLSARLQWLADDVLEVRHGVYEPDYQILDVDIQDDMVVGPRLEVSFGANLRALHLDISGANDGDAMAFITPNTTEYLYAMFVNNRFSLTDRMDLSVGVKAETWTLVSDEPEFSPSARLLWRVNERASLWSAYSRSVSTPGFTQTRIEWVITEIPITPETEDLLLPGTDELYWSIVPSSDLKATRHDTYEVGFRAQLTPCLFVDASVFYDRTTGYIYLDMAPGNAPPEYSRVYPNRTLLPFPYANISDGTSYGGELVVRVNPTANVRLEASYSHIDTETEARPVPGQPGRFYGIDEVTTYTPEHIVRLRPYLDFPTAGLYLSASLTWRSEYDHGDDFDYVTQAFSWFPVGWTVDPEDNNLELNVTVEKRFFSDRFSVTVWGRDLLVDEEIEAYDFDADTGYPHSVHRTFGASVCLNP